MVSNINKLLVKICINWKKLVNNFFRFIDLIIFDELKVFDVIKICLIFLSFVIFQLEELPLLISTLSMEPNNFTAVSFSENKQYFSLNLRKLSFFINLKIITIKKNKN